MGIFNLTFEYTLLGRLKLDCEVYLSDIHNYRQDPRCLWAGSPQAQIDKMREIWGSVPEKPEWLTLEQINEYATKMGVK